jgi:hypothetical protein
VNSTNDNSCGSNSDTVCDDPDTCQAGECQVNNEPATTTCDDDTECTSTSTVAGDPDLCDGDGSCAINNVVVGGACGDDTDTDCNDPDTCDGNGTCVDNFQPATTTCTDNDACTSTDGVEGGPDNCNGQGNGGAACVTDDIVCDENDVDPGDGQCNTSVCNATGFCEDLADNEGGSCSDGNICTSATGDLTCDLGTGDVCDAVECSTDICEAGVCTGIDIDTDGDGDADCDDQVEVFKRTLIGGVPFPGSILWDFSLTGLEVNETQVIDSQSIEPGVCVDTVCNGDFDGASLVEGYSYTMCETGIPAGWSALFELDGAVVGDCDGDGIPDPEQLDCIYNPDACDVNVQGCVSQDLGNRCVDFSVECDLAAAEFSITDTFPGGCPRTIGFWKNWNTCTEGGQADNAARNGGPLAGWFLLDDLLSQQIGELSVDSCEEGVYVLDKRAAVSTRKGRKGKKANDAAYELASQLLAAQVNLTVGAVGADPADCPDGEWIVDIVVEANQLLTCGGFNGEDSYWSSKGAGSASDDCGDIDDPNGVADRQDALRLAGLLDAYNNGFLCPGNSGDSCN